MIRDVFFMSLDALRTHKIRTFLTLVGVIIGIGSVIMVTTAGSSVGTFIEDQWNIFNPTGMVIGIGTASDPPQISFNKIAFTNNDIEALKKLPYVQEVAPIGILILRNIKIREGFLKWESKPGFNMYATTPALLNLMGLEIDQGRIFQDGKNEVVISKSMTTIFGQDKALKIGDTIYIQRLDGRSIKTTIVGILKEAQNTNILSQVTTINIAGPVNPYYTTYFGSNVGGLLKRVTAFGILYASATNKEHVDTVKNEIINYLNTSSDALNYKDKNSDFVVITQQYIISKVDQVVSVMTMLITAIALISLIVGGIGIANIMFATVTERTREIGTMMAIGAKRRDIMRLFLFQSAMIGFLGGLLGVILGASGGAFVIQILNSYLSEIGGAFSKGNIVLIYSTEWFLIALAFGIVIGIIAGVLPARKAAKMDPVEALRYQ